MKGPPPSVRLAIALAAALAAPTPGALAQTSPFTEVTVDLDGGLVRQTLPFDEPFVFTGEAPTGVRSIVVRCWEVKSCRQVQKRGSDAEKAACAGKEKTATLLPDRESAPDGNCRTWPRPGDRGALAGLPSWTNRVDPGEATPTFSIFVPLLEAERYYTFGFSWDRTPSPEEAAAFAAAVAAAADGVLWTAEAADGPTDGGPPASGDLTDGDLASLRGTLVAALQAAAVGRIQDCSKSPVLCPDVPVAQVRHEFNGLLRDVRNAQGQLGDTIENYKGDVDQVNVALGLLAGSGELAALLRGLQTAAADTPSLGEEAAALQEALALEHLPDLTEEDRQTPDALAAFAARTGEAAGRAAAPIGKVRTLLQSGLFDDQGGPTALLQRLTAAGTLTPETAQGLMALAEPRGLVGSVDRALARLQGQAADLESALADRAAARAALAAEFKTRVEVIVLLAGTTLADFVTAQKNYLSGDGGLAFAPELDEASSYLGTNIYSRPINKKAALSQFGNFWQTLDRRTALTLGLTVDGIGDDTTREDLIGSQSLLVGLGVRLTASMRVTAGAIVFIEKDPNPLVDDDSLAATPFLSLSFDVNVVPALTGLGNAFKAN